MCITDLRKRLDDNISLRRNIELSSKKNRKNSIEYLQLKQENYYLKYKICSEKLESILQEHK